MVTRDELEVRIRTAHARALATGDLGHLREEVTAVGRLDGERVARVDTGAEARALNAETVRLATAAATTPAGMEALKVVLADPSAATVRRLASDGKPSTGPVKR